MSGDQEVPARITTGSGTGVLVVNSTTLTYALQVDYSNLLGTVVGAHIHAAAAGVNGSVIIGLPTTNPIVFGGVFSAGQYTALLAGGLYVNIHSSVFAGGEIRGQIVPAPASLGALALGGLLAARRRR